MKYFFLSDYSKISSCDYVDATLGLAIFYGTPEIIRKTLHLCLDHAFCSKDDWENNVLDYLSSLKEIEDIELESTNYDESILIISNKISEILEATTRIEKASETFAKFKEEDKGLFNRILRNISSLSHISEGYSISQKIYEAVKSRCSSKLVFDDSSIDLNSEDSNPTKLFKWSIVNSSLAITVDDNNIISGYEIDNQTNIMGEDGLKGFM